MAAVVILLSGKMGSPGTFRRLIGQFRRNASFEIAFTLFNMIWLHEWPQAKAGKRKYLSLAKWYLKNVPRDQGLAATETAHLLASEWAGPAGLSTLIAVAESARHEEGRLAALTGISFRIDNGKLSEKDRKAIRALLSSMAKRDTGKPQLLANFYLRELTN